MPRAGVPAVIPVSGIAKRIGPAGKQAARRKRQPLQHSASRPEGRASRMTSTSLTAPAGQGTAGAAPRVGMFLPTLAGLSPDTAATARLLATIAGAGLD